MKQYENNRSYVTINCTWQEGEDDAKWRQQRHPSIHGGDNGALRLAILRRRKRSSGKLLITRSHTLYKEAIYSVLINRGQLSIYERQHASFPSISLALYRARAHPHILPAMRAWRGACAP